MEVTRREAFWRKGQGGPRSGQAPNLSMSVSGSLKVQAPPGGRGQWCLSFPTQDDKAEGSGALASPLRMIKTTQQLPQKEL